MDVTVSVDDRMLERAREKAEALGMSLDELVREYLESLAGADAPERDDPTSLSKRSPGHPYGWRHGRDEPRGRS